MVKIFLNLLFSPKLWIVIRQWILFRLPPEFIHNQAIAIAGFISSRLSRKPNLGLTIIRQLAEQQGTKLAENLDLSVNIGSLEWSNPIGLAAGLDKDGEAPLMWAACGFGAVELGTVTVKAQPGNIKPRMFRLKEHQALINRMGFNNKGMHNLYDKLSPWMQQKSNWPQSFSLGINLGKNKDTNNEQASREYLQIAQKFIGFADYFTVNISSPNTPGLRELQHGDMLENILSVLQDNGITEKKPILLKLAPDLEAEPLVNAAFLAQKFGLIGIIMGNTTIQRQPWLPESTCYGHQHGGLSGKPLFPLALSKVEYLYREFPSLPIIATGGIDSFFDVKAYLSKGAAAVQVYTGLIYRGPGLAYQILADLKKEMLTLNINTFQKYRQHLLGKSISKEAGY